jgi:L-2,4-diaminobutyrate transaminase
MLSDLHGMDLTSHLHPYTNFADLAAHGPTILSGGSGVWVRDSAGRTYIDAMSGLWCCDVGYGREEIAEAIARQARELPFYHTFFGMANEPAIRLADRLKHMVPWPIARVFFGLSGSDANDTQIKLIWLYNTLRGKPQKTKILSRRMGYHGITLGASSLTGLPAVHAHMNLPLPGFLHLSTPHHYRYAAPGMSEAEFVAALVQELERTIEAEGADTIAAFFAEPVMGAGGVLVPPAGYFPAMQAVLRKHDILFVADEVICGFGRLGQPWGSLALGIEPDMVTIAKGLTSGYAPLSAALISEKVWSVLAAHEDLLPQLNHGFTYSGHPLCAAAAHANLDIMEREDLFGRAAETGTYLQSRLRETFGDHPHVGEVRGIGMIAALEVVVDRETRAVLPPELKLPLKMFRRMLDRGVIARTVGASGIALCPPYVIEREEIDTALGVIRDTIDEIVPAALRAALNAGHASRGDRHAGHQD